MFSERSAIRTEKDFPEGYAHIQICLGTAYSDLPTGDKGENLIKSIEYYKNALQIYSEEKFPERYAMIQNNLGLAYSDLPIGDSGENLKNTIYCYKNAAADLD